MMAKHLMKCKVCGSYTMKDKHCDRKTISPKPMKYSPEDRLGRYRRIAKRQQGLV